MASMRAMERPTRHPLVEANAALADLRQGLASLLQASLLPPPIQKFLEELPLFLNIAPWWPARVEPSGVVALVVAVPAPRSRDLRTDRIRQDQWRGLNSSRSLGEP